MGSCENLETPGAYSEDAESRATVATDDGESSWESVWIDLGGEG